MSQTPPPFPDYFSLFQQIASPFVAQSAAAPDEAARRMMAALDPKEIEKKIAELKTVHGWLVAQSGVVEMTVKTMEYQLAFIKHSGHPPPAASGEAQPNPAVMAWNMMQQPFSHVAATKPAAAARQKKTRSRPKS